MSVVSLLGINVLNNPAKFGDPYSFEITFECLEPLQNGKLPPPCYLYTKAQRNTALQVASHPAHATATSTCISTRTAANPSHRSRVEAHLRRLRPIRPARPRARLPACRSNPSRREQVHLRGFPARHQPHPRCRDPRRHRHPPHLLLRRPRVRPRRLLCQQRVR